MSSDDTSDDASAVISERYDPDGDRRVSLHVVRLVAIASDREPTELEPLHWAIDTDALDMLIDPKTASRRNRSVVVSFEYEGYRIEIAADGLVSLFVETDDGC